MTVVIIGNDGLYIPTEDTEAGIPTKECCTEVPKLMKLDHLSLVIFPESETGSHSNGLGESIHSARWADEQGTCAQYCKLCKNCKTPACCNTTQQVTTHTTNLWVFLDNGANYTLTETTHSIDHTCNVFLQAHMNFPGDHKRDRPGYHWPPKPIEHQPWYFIITS